MIPYWTLVVKRAKERKRRGLPPFTEAQKRSARYNCACSRIREWPIVSDYGEKPFRICESFAHHVESGSVTKAAEALSRLELLAAGKPKKERKK